MFSEIAFVFCAILAIQASFGFCLPTGSSENKDLEIDKPTDAPEIKEKEEEEEGYYVILKSPTQSLKLEVIEEDRKPFSDKDLFGSEEEGVTEAIEENSKKEKRNEKTDQTSKVEVPLSYKCNWRRLYKLYVFKKRATEGKYFYFARERRKELRKAFQVICQNPEETILQLLELEE